MDVGLRTPLLDFFRRGEVARELRLMAAEGAVAPRPLEQLGLLVLLSADSDAEVRTTADRTLTRLPSAITRSAQRAETVTSIATGRTAGGGGSLNPPAGTISGCHAPASRGAAVTGEWYRVEVSNRVKYATPTTSGTIAPIIASALRRKPVHRRRPVSIGGAAPGIGSSSGCSARKAIRVSSGGRPTSPANRRTSERR